MKYSRRGIVLDVVGIIIGVIVKALLYFSNGWLVALIIKNRVVLDQSLDTVTIVAAWFIINCIVAVALGVTMSESFRSLRTELVRKREAETQWLKNANKYQTPLERAGF